jgi:hypothetical protein
MNNFIEFTQSTVYESAYSKSSEYVEEKGRKLLCRLVIYSIRVLSTKKKHDEIALQLFKSGVFQVGTGIILTHYTNHE